MRVGLGFRVKLEELAEVVLREMPSGIFRFVHHAGREILLLTSGGLALAAVDPSRRAHCL